MTICQRYEDFSVASTNSGLDPCRTTGKICRQSPAKSTVSPPNGDDFFRMSCIFPSIDSEACLCPIMAIENSRNLAFNNIAQRQKSGLHLGLYIFVEHTTLDLDLVLIY